jgi:hypothetical protein
MMNGARVVGAGLGSAVGVDVASGVAVAELPPEVQAASAATMSAAATREVRR